LSAPEKYCAAPWAGAILAVKNKQVRVCCKNPHSIGTWADGGLEEAWHSDQAVSMRESIAKGDFPDRFCELCFENRTQMNLRTMVQKAFRDTMDIIRSQSAWALLEDAEGSGVVSRAHLSKSKSLVGKVYRQFDFDLKRRIRLHDCVKELPRFRSLFERKEWDHASEEILDRFRMNLNLLLRDYQQRHKEDSTNDLYTENCWTALEKLGAIADIVEDFLKGELRPRRIAPFRQVNVIAICNARCVHCPMLFSGSIIDGLTVTPGEDEKYKYATEEQIDDFFTNMDDVIDYFTFGSEFLFHPKWQLIAEKLAEQSVRLRVSTNGMLITQKNVDKLLGNNWLGKLNISVDGSSPETIEKIRVNVKYDRLNKNVRYFFLRAAELNVRIPTSFSFVLVKDNYHELADFVRLVADWSEGSTIKPHIVIQGLGLKGVPSYRDHVYANHHSVVPEDDLRKAFDECLKASQETGIGVVPFYTGTIAEFVDQGYPFPRLYFSTVGDRDNDDSTADDGELEAVVS